jgi:hypothetical protein
VYAIIPVAIVVGLPSSHHTERLWITTSLMEGTYFVNAASSFYLSALLEKHKAGSHSRGELTSITFPSALIEGTETVFAYSLFLLWPEMCDTFFLLFALGVCVNVIQRLLWAYHELPKLEGSAERSD